MRRISTTWLANQLNKPRDKRTVLSIASGLSVRVSPKGKIAFFFRYLWMGKESTYSIGTFPDTSLDEAKMITLKLREVLKEGKNPGLIRKEKLQQASEALTLDDIWNTWITETYAPNKKAKTVASRANSYKTYVQPVLGALLVEDITGRDYEELIFDIKKTSPSTAKYLLHSLKSALNKAEKAELISRNKLALYCPKDFSITVKSKDRYLTKEELRVFFRIINSDSFSPKKAAYLKLLLVMGCRKGELRLAKYSDFEGCIDGHQVWIVPPENHKQGKRTNKPLVRPVNKEILKQLDIIKACGNCDYVYGNTKTNRPNYTTFDTRWFGEVNRVLEQPLTIHDLRHTNITLMSDFTEYPVQLKINGHRNQGIHKVYNKNLFLPQIAEAYEQWITVLNDLGMNGNTNTENKLQLITANSSHKIKYV